MMRREILPTVKLVKPDCRNNRKGRKGRSVNKKLSRRIFRSRSKRILVKEWK